MQPAPLPTSLHSSFLCSSLIAASIKPMASKPHRECERTVIRGVERVIYQLTTHAKTYYARKRMVTLQAGAGQKSAAPRSLLAAATASRGCRSLLDLNAGGLCGECDADWRAARITCITPRKPCHTPICRLPRLAAARIFSEDTGGHTRTYLLLGMAEGVGTRAHVCCWAWSWAWAFARNTLSSGAVDAVCAHDNFS
jgi:hypothetical protein